MLRFFRYPVMALSLLLFSGFTKPREATEGPGKLLPYISAFNANLLTDVNAIGSVLSSKYHEWKLAALGLKEEVFASAVKGFEKLRNKGMLANHQILSIVDFSQPSANKRLYIINLVSGTILYHTLVAHGRNSGMDYATKFSNMASSFESSPGFYITSNTYRGKNGYSLKLKGCEKGINDNADKRAIVVHGADYVSENFIAQNGHLGRSHGCPAVPEELNEEIINTIKNGSCLFIYAPSQKYFKQSAILNR